MAETWLAKAPTEVVERQWTLGHLDTISAVSAVGTGVTVDSADYGLNVASVMLSGGTNQTTASVTVTVTTADDRTLTQTFLIAIRASTNAFAYTARDVVDFALRKIVGNGVSADSAEADDALERLNDMLADWRMDGCDIGVPAPLTLGTTLAIPDEYVSALKFNLRIACHDHYDAPITAYDADRADRGKRNIVNRLTRFGDLSSPFGLSSTNDTVADLF